MDTQTANKLKEGDEVFYAGAFYEVARMVDFPHGAFIAIYDEPPSKHVDYLNPNNVMEVIPCNECQGQGCPTCSGHGKLIQ